jgi:hypothetical protein
VGPLGRARASAPEGIAAIEMLPTVVESLYRGRTEEACDQLAYHWARSDRAVAALALSPPQRDALRLTLAGLHFVVGER